MKIYFLLLFVALLGMTPIDAAPPCNTDITTPPCTPKPKPCASKEPVTATPCTPKPHEPPTLPCTTVTTTKAPCTTTTTCTTTKIPCITTTTCTTTPPLCYKSRRDCASLPDGQILLDCNHCRRYYVCTNKRAVINKCDAGQWIDGETLTCRARSLVTNRLCSRN